MRKKIYFYTKSGCPLCDKGLLILKELEQDYSFSLIQRDIYNDDNWLETYQIRIPVVEDEEGNVLDEGILSSQQLRISLYKMFK